MSDLPTSFYAQLMAEEPKAPDPRLSTLTPREREVLRALCKGQTSKQLAGDLGIDWRTVDQHAASIREKLGVASKLQAILIAYGVEGKEPLV